MMMMVVLKITALMQHMVQYRSEAAQYWESSAATTVTVGGGDMSRIRCLYVQYHIFCFSFYQCDMMIDAIVAI